MEKITDFLQASITVLFQLLLAAVLIALLLGEAAGPVIGNILANTRAFLSGLNPAAAAVAFVLYLMWTQFRPQRP